MYANAAHCAQAAIAPEAIQLSASKEAAAAATATTGHAKSMPLMTEVKAFRSMIAATST